MKHTLIIILVMLISRCVVSAKSQDILQACWAKQVQPLQNAYISFNFQESAYTLAHLSEPWQANHATSRGSIWCSSDRFMKADTANMWGNIYYSKTQLDTSALLFLDYGDREISKITRGTFADEPIEEARYSPVLLINYAHKHAMEAVQETNKRFSIYALQIGKTLIKMFIDKKDALLKKVSMLSNDDQFGDVTKTINYSGFIQVSTLSYPGRIEIDKMNGKLKDTVTLNAAQIVQTVEPVLPKPADYKFIDEMVTIPEVSVETYSDHIHFITLKHTNGRSMVVEFKDYLLVAEAPLSSKNGELIISEAMKIAPGKPVKYFVFGHYHPDYTGGIRPFVHKGATVLCTKDDVPFVQYLAGTPHTLEPDSLQLQPRQLKTEETGEHKTIADEKYEMDIYHIGSKSAHTKDYLIYYFPQEKMLFEGDLVYISADNKPRRANMRQAGLYNAIKELHLDVKTIEQSWPVANYGVKSEIAFGELEDSINLK